MIYNQFRYRILVTFCVSLFSAVLLQGQNITRLSGYVHDETGEPVEDVNIAVRLTESGAITSQIGFYQLKLNKRSTYVLQVSKIGFERQEITVRASDYSNPVDIRFDIVLNKSVQVLNEAVIRPDRDPGANLLRIDPKLIFILPDPSGNFEGLIKI